jgi:hypothetical protein
MSSYTVATPQSGDYVLGIKKKDPGNPASRNQTSLFSTDELKSVGLGYKSYEAKVTQSGSDDPVAVVLYNNTGLTFTWSRIANGFYQVAPSTNFVDAGKVMVLFTAAKTPNGITVLNDTNESEISFENIVTTSGPISSGIDNGNVEIRIYP